MNRFVEAFNSISTTNARIIFTLFLAFGTAIRYWSTGEPPDRDWLIFLVSMAGIDALQFHSKRKTTFPPTGNVSNAADDEEEDEDSSASTDVREHINRG